MDFKSRRLAEEEIRRINNTNIQQQITGKVAGMYSPERNYGPRMTKKEWIYAQDQLRRMTIEIQRALWFAQVFDDSETKASLEDSIGWIKQYLEDVRLRMGV